MKKIVLSSVLAASMILSFSSCGNSKDTNKLVGENGSKDNTKVELGDKSTNQSSSTDTVSFAYDKSAMQGQAIHIKISGEDYSVISIVGENQYFDIIGGDIYPKDTTPNKRYNLQLNLKNNSTNETKKLNLNLTVEDGGNSSNSDNNSNSNQNDNNNSDQNSGNNSNSDQNSGSDNNNSQGGGQTDQNGNSQNSNTEQGDGSSQSGSTGNFVVSANGLQWTALKKEDDNATLSGRITFNEAKARCQEIGARLPTHDEITVAAPTLKSNSSFRADAANLVIVWFSDGNGERGYFFNGKGSDEDTDNYSIENPTNDTTEYYTCVKQVGQ